MYINSLNENQVSKLMGQQYMCGLENSLRYNVEDDFALRMWIIDNSGSMQNSDGRRFSINEDDSDTNTIRRSSSSSFLSKLKEKEKDKIKAKCSEIKAIRCKRWDEIIDCMNYQIEVADAMKLPTSFRFLNDPGCVPQKFAIHMEERGNESDEESSIGFVHSDDSSMESLEASSSHTFHTAYEELPMESSSSHTFQPSCTHPILDETHMVSAQEAMKFMKLASPGGCTPLTNHILDIQREIVKMEPQLRKSGKRVSITIATDGLPTDDQGYEYAAQQREFVEALRSLEGLPVWVVIRLCTDEYHVVKFYNQLDSEVNLPMDVLDDYKGEAYEVYHANPWLNYALPLHRLREMGHHNRTFDLIDERLLTKSELYDFCHILFGQDNFQKVGIPHPAMDWVGFIKGIKVLLENESLQWNPIKKEAKPWINLKKLNQIYGNSLFKRLGLNALC